MNKKHRNVWGRIAVSFVLATVFGFVAYVILMGLPAVITWSPFWDRGDPQTVLAQDTYSYTTFLPIIYNNFCQSSRTPLRNTGNFTGQVKIQAPKTCTTGVEAETPIVVSGTYTETPADSTIWVLAYAPDTLYYPQSPNACQGKPPYQDYDNGIWNVPAYLGEAGGPPEWFDIVVILTDEATSQELGDQMIDWCNAEDYEGYKAEDLNAMTITEMDYITVQTLD